MPTVDDILAEQQAMNLMMEELQKATDPKAFNQILAAIQESGKRIEEMSQAFADAFYAEHAEALAQSSEAVVPKIEVLLTPEQRQRVFEASGVDIPSVKLVDPTGALNAAMPSTPPPFIEAQAIKQAEAFKEMVAAQEAAAAAVAEALAELEANASPEMLEEIAKLKADPNFLAGLVK